MIVLLPIVNADVVNDIVGTVAEPVIPYCETVIWTLPPTLADVVANSVAVFVWLTTLRAIAFTNDALAVKAVPILAEVVT